MQTVPDADRDLRVLVLSPVSTRADLRRQLIPLGAKLTFAETIAELSQVTRDADVYQVALIPASLPHSEWWELWGAISMLAVRPAILVYSEFSSFELWSGVLDFGGYDVQAFADDH